MIDEDFLRKLGNAGKFSRLSISVRHTDGRLDWSCKNPDGSIAVGVGDDIPGCLADLKESLLRVTGRTRQYEFDKPRLREVRTASDGEAGSGDSSAPSSPVSLPRPDQSLDDDLMDMLG